VNVSNTKIITAESLQPYFYKSLSELNRKSLCPLPEEVLFYSSDVLNRYTLSSNYFEESEGKLREKTLGVKLLEAEKYSPEEKVEFYREIGDTTMVLCGFFSSSIKEKLVDRRYYLKIAQTAYQNLNSHIPTCFNIPSFYKVLATSFENITSLVSVLSESHQNDPYSNFLLNSEGNSDCHSLIRGVTPNPSKKAS
jgi:hypothetical protein